jgi:hypothetical protein
MRRLSLMFVLVGLLAGCSAGSSNVASSKPSSTPIGASSTVPTGTSSTGAKASTSPTATKPTATKPHKVIIGGATSFCAAFKEMQSARTTDGAAVTSAVYLASAADMRKYAPAAIKSQANSYAVMIEEAGKALKAGTMPTGAVSKPADLKAVTAWVTKHCPKK